MVFWMSWVSSCALAALAHNEWQNTLYPTVAGALKSADCRIYAVFNVQSLTRCGMGGKKNISLDSTAVIKNGQVLGFTPDR